MRFGIESFIDNCTTLVVNTSFAGQPTTKCGNLLWVELPSGAPIQVGWAAVNLDPPTQQVLDAALATITFHD